MNLLQIIHKDLISEDIERRSIKNLIHFTATSNINSILQNGIMSKDTLTHQGMSHTHNDEMRLEGLLNSISLSIEFPNYSMFSKYRLYDNPKDMAVIQIDPKVLLDKDCAFYHTNAASVDFHGIPLQELKKYESWSSMFSELYKGINRTELCIPPNYTTHPQAEVLCFDRIEPEYIKCITFENQTHFDRNYKKYNYSPELFDKSMYILNSIHYNARSDYQYWKKD